MTFILYFGMPFFFAYIIYKIVMYIIHMIRAVRKVKDKLP